MTKQTTMTPAAMRAHVYALADAFDVTIVEASTIPDQACAIPGLRVVYCYRIIDETTYAVALHEIGHIVAPLGFVRDTERGNVDNLQRIEESAAWEWARHYSLIWTPVMEHVATWAEGTYAAVQSATPRAAAPRKQEIDWSKW